MNGCSVISVAAFAMAGISDAGSLIGGIEMTGASGALWNAGTTWQDGMPATSGSSYQVTGKTLSSPTAVAGLISFPGDSLLVQSGATLRLRVSLGPQRFETNSPLPVQFVSSTLELNNLTTGASDVAVNAGLEFHGNNLVAFRGASGTGKVFRFNGPLTGDGGTLTIASQLTAPVNVEFADGAMNFQGDVVMGGATISPLMNVFVGGQFIANSLQVRNATMLVASNGLPLINRLTLDATVAGGVNINQPTSQKWTELVVNSGTLRVNGPTEFGSLSGTGTGLGTGRIIGGGTSPVLWINQTKDGSYAGTFADASAADPTTWIKTGLSNLTLTGNSSVAGTVVVREGILWLGGSGGINPARFDVESQGSLVFAGNGTTTYTGELDGSGFVVKTGSGRTELKGDGDFAGNLQIVSGELSIDGQMPYTAVNVHEGTLGGNGRILNAFVEAGGTVAPGNSIGTLSLQSLTLHGTYQAEYSKSLNMADMLRVSGLLELHSATLFFKDLDGAGIFDGQPHVLVEYGSRTGTFGQVLNLPAGYRLAYGEGGNTISLVPVPECGTTCGFVTACLLVAVRRRRR